MGYGAEWLSAEQFSRDVDLMIQLCQRRDKSRKNSPKRFLANTLDAESQQRLAMLRKALI
jgi:predicted RNA-binding protein with PIN domain